MDSQQSSHRLAGTEGLPHLSSASPYPESEMDNQTAQGKPAANHAQEDLKLLLERADQAREAGDSPRAHLAYRQATQIDPRSAEAWIGRATTGQDLDDVILSWAYAGALSPGNPQIRGALNERVREKLAASEIGAVPSLLALAKALGETGQKANAYALARRATELDENIDDAWVWRGGLAEDRQEMISCLRQALALNPNNVQAKAGLEWAQPLQGSGDGPTLSPSEESQKALKEGLVVLRQGDRLRASELFQHATELDANNEQAWLWRGSTTYDIDEALTCVEQALALNPDNESAREARSWLRVKKLRAGSKSSDPKPSEMPPVPKNGAARQANRLNRILPLAFVVLALIILVLVLLYTRVI